jgi:hypothetical protein
MNTRVIVEIGWPEALAALEDMAEDMALDYPSNRRFSELDAKRLEAIVRTIRSTT